MPWQPRHEDILGTFLFFLITGLALFQIMIGYRRTQGMSIYGSAIRPALNYILGLVLLAAGVAWYFAKPANRNVPGIEGFMSLFCMALGLVAAAALSCFLATAARSIQRKRARARLFKERGIFSREVARRFRDEVLARGGTEHPMVLYERFRGRKPDADALLRRDGLI